MAESEIAQVEGDEDDVEFDFEDSGKRKGSVIGTLLVGLIGLGGGGFLGMQQLGPRLGPILADRAEASANTVGEKGGGGGHGGGAEAAPTAIHVIDNLVVNPARSGGTRFLLASIAVETNFPEQTSIVADRDIALRSSLIMVLGSKSVEELTDMTLRAGISQEILLAIEQITGSDVVRRVFIPQFVIQ